MGSEQININTIRRNLVMIRSHLREVSRRVEGNVYDETVLIVRKHIQTINELLHPTN